MKNKTMAYGLIVGVLLSFVTPPIQAKQKTATATFEIAAGIAGVVLTPCLLFMAFAQHDYAKKQQLTNTGNELGFHQAATLCKVSAAAMLTLSAISIKNGIQKLNEKKKKKSKHRSKKS